MGVGGSGVFSHDGKHRAGSDSRWDEKGKVVSSEVRSWDAQTGKEIFAFLGHTSWVSKLAFSPDGRLMASSSKDQTLRVWDLQTGKEIRTLKGQTDGRSLAFSPDGKRLARDGFASVMVW